MKRKLLIIAGIMLIVVASRVALEPKDHTLPFQGIASGDLDNIRTELSNPSMAVDAVVSLLRSKRLVLVGETHFVQEPQRYLTTLLDRLADSSIVLLLELSEDSQDDIDLYMRSGDVRYLEAVTKKRNNLPLAHILRWSFENRAKVKRVIAFDQNFWRVGLNRLFLSDTRNQTMCDAVLEACRKYPEARIVAYAGQMHMLLAGRYRFDLENRSPAGARILKGGISRSDIINIMLSGRRDFPLDTLWKTPGALLMNGAIGELPYEYFINYPVFGSRRAGELFDVFVNLGPLTEIPR